MLVGTMTGDLDLESNNNSKINLLRGKEYT